MSAHHSAPEKASSRKAVWFWLIALCVVVFFIVSKNLHKITKAPGAQQNPDVAAAAGSSSGSTTKPSLSRTTADPGDGPRGAHIYVYDRSPDGKRYLLSKALHKDALHESDAPAGRDLWIQDEDGERLIAESVYRARFSPDGQKIAYGTSEVVMHIEDLNGTKIAEVPRAYEPNWHPDSSSVVYTRVPDDRPLHNPEVLGITTYNIATAETKQLTDGTWDDVRPHYSPDGNWVLFVSGGRTGLASFWQVSANGGEPVQVTNNGLNEVNEKFVPTPYDRSLWSNDKSWFVYDFKRGDDHQIWGLKFDPTGKFQGAINVGQGLDPKFGPDGRTLIAQRQDGHVTRPVQYTLP